MKLLIYNSCDQEADYPAYTLVNITPEVARTILDRMEFVKRLHAEDCELLRVTYSAYYLGITCSNDSEHYIDEDYAEVPEDYTFRADDLVSLDVANMVVDEDSVFFKMSARHDDFYFESRDFGKKQLEEMAGRLAA